MAWVLVVVTAVLAVLVLALAVLVVGLRGRVVALEAAGSSSRHANAWSGTARNHAFARLDDPEAAPTRYLITHVGDVAAPVEPAEPAEPVATVSAPVFADLVLKETVVQTASLLQGVRRALAPETRNRIRFHMRREVKRSRKQRRTELREVRREWQARQRESAA